MARFRLRRLVTAALAILLLLTSRTKIQLGNNTNNDNNTLNLNLNSNSNLLNDYHDYCEWAEDDEPNIKMNSTGIISNLDDCYRLLKGPTHNATLWYFLGDSTMGRLFSALVEAQAQGSGRGRGPVLLQEVIKSDKCDKAKLKYYGFQPAPIEMRIAPNASNGQGPGAPRSHNRPFQTSCKTCCNQLVRFSYSHGDHDHDDDDKHDHDKHEHHEHEHHDHEHHEHEHHEHEHHEHEHEDSATATATTTTDIRGQQHHYAEFLAMEYANDVTFSTRNTSTSQETAIMYMRQQKQQRQHQENTATVCVLNMGFHDFEIRPRLTPELYAQNVMDLQQALLLSSSSSSSEYQNQNQLCDKVLWISMNAMDPTKSKARDLENRNNTLVELWNAAVQSQMKMKLKTKRKLNNHNSYDSYDSYYLNIYPKSLHTPNGIDAVHMDKELFYKPLARIFASLMTDSSSSSFFGP